ncbi:hypothetical protein [Thermocaproicibacter melissae]|uniref:hypothetical protein n=1 Tax=Thermocaproicibacter melissae TaxID=2966552 RepID=UPI0024B1FCC7|nr:hypothetical protein [Thermocaproicibacter melissae]WBY63689.1 hypothetical protein NOG13_06885 [Thermocaproicibacter melissae]
MKQRKEFLLDKSTIAYLEKYRDEHHLQTMTAALTKIIDEHRHRNDIDTTEIIIQHIAKRVGELLDDKLTRIRLGVNNADRNSDIIIMLLNTLLGYQELTSLITEDTPQLKRAKEIEKERIENFREKKLDRETKKANKTPEIIPDELIME